MALFGPNKDGFTFLVEEWSDRDQVLAVLAGAENVLVARAAYDVCRKQYPEKRLTLRQGIRVIAESG